MLSLKKGYKIRVKVHGKGGVFFPQQTSMASTFEINCRDREINLDIFHRFQDDMLLLIHNG